MIGFSLGAITRWTWPPPIPSIRSVVLFYGTGAATSAAREPLTSVTLPTTTSTSRRRTSMPWRKRCGVQVAR